MDLLLCLRMYVCMYVCLYLYICGVCIICCIDLSKLIMFAINL